MTETSTVVTAKMEAMLAAFANAELATADFVTALAVDGEKAERKDRVKMVVHSMIVAQSCFTARENIIRLMRPVAASGLVSDDAMGDAFDITKATAGNRVEKCVELLKDQARSLSPELSVMEIGGQTVIAANLTRDEQPQGGAAVEYKEREEKADEEEDVPHTREECEMFTKLTQGVMDQGLTVSIGLIEWCSQLRELTRGRRFTVEFAEAIMAIMDELRQLDRVVATTIDRVADSEKLVSMADIDKAAAEFKVAGKGTQETANRLARECMSVIMASKIKQAQDQQAQAQV